MAPAPVLTIGLTTVRSEFNVTFPKRDKKSDGWIGDLTHQLESSSGHNPDITGRAEWKDGDSLNEVRAIDVDDDLNDPSCTMEKIVQYLVQKARSGAYVPFRYIIYKGRIWRRTNGWKTETYTGPSPHTEHVHFSGDYTQTADNWKGSLNLRSLTKGDDFMAFIENQTEFNHAIATAFKANLYSGGRSVDGSLMGATIDNVIEVKGTVSDTEKKIDVLEGKINTLTSLVTQLIAAKS